jgi:hypothetical protein
MAPNKSHVGTPFVPLNYPPLLYVYAFALFCFCKYFPYLSPIFSCEMRWFDQFLRGLKLERKKDKRVKTFDQRSVQKDRERNGQKLLLEGVAK